MTNEKELMFQCDECGENKKMSQFGELREWQYNEDICLDCLAAIREYLVKRSLEDE